MKTRKPAARRGPSAPPARRRSWRTHLLTAAVLIAIVAVIIVRYRSRSATAAGPAPGSSASAQPQPTPATSPRIDPNRAMGYVRDIVAFGPRFVSSPGYRKTQAYIRERLKGVEVEEDPFTAATPVGRLAMRNIIAKFPGARPGVVVIATHYDTLYGRKDFVGANDGGSGTGLLLELANQLRGPGRNGYSIWLVWLDGEEAIRQWSQEDSLYGSRHLAQKWQNDGALKQIKAFLLADMIGDADLDIERDDNSTPWLETLIYQAATDLGFQSHFFAIQNAIDDDHIPFARAGVPVADLIDFSYPRPNAITYWHTSADTLDKLSPRSLQIAGDVILKTVWMLDAR